jgi:DNA-binding MarR family transcriptional regulator
VRVGELEGYIKETFHVGRTQATEDLAWLFAKGWLTRGRSDADGRVKIVVRTEKARERLASWHGIGMPLPFLRGLPRVTASGGPDLPTSEHPAAVPAEKLQDDSNEPAAVADEPEADPVAARRAARAAEERRRERSLINDTFRIHFGGNPTYVQLLTHPDDSLAALFHEQLRVGYDDSGLTVRRSFISPRDPSLGGPEALDPITDRVLRDDGYPPAQKLFAWAVQLRKTKHGFEVATRIENGQKRDNVGLIVQAPRNFYLHLTRIPDLTSRIIKVVRKTAKKTTKNGVEKKIDYRCEAIGDALPVSYELPDLETVLNEIADEEFARETLDSLTADWKLVKKLPWWMHDLQPAPRYTSANTPRTPQEAF